ncbi:MAG: ABC transporter substrate-binding protein [Verrucomicrobiota bacterium]|nr:ABC transporter substrate-binding protein [Verrucomicrobiota bacterium]MEC8279043.1 ABC transporter substrate-binding protein [Verrucomicrobiota bacterium]
MKFFSYVVSLVLGLLLVVSVSAQELQKEKLQGMIDTTLDVIYSQTHASLSANEKQLKVRQKLESSYDLDVMIRYAIGKNWRRMNKTEQLQVLELVKQLVLKAYVIGLEGKDRPTVTFGELTEIGKARIEIESTMVLDAKTYNILYRLRLMDSGWQIYDIVAENVSMSSNYRGQIDDHFRKGSAADLIARLRDLLAKDEINEDTKI